MTTLAESLARDVREGDLWERIDDQRIRCYACGHCCPISEGQAGVCKVSFHRDGKMYVPWGYVQSAQCDPIEKKPFFHVRPGGEAWLRSAIHTKCPGVTACRGGQHLQRTADHRRMGGRDLPPCQGRRIDDRFCVEWQCHAPGARLPPPLGGPVQSPSEVLGRPPL